MFCLPFSIFFKACGVFFMPQKNNSFKNEFFDWLEIFTSSVIALVVLFTFVFKVVTITGNSMKDTLYNGEKIVISNVFYEPKAGDIVVISRNVNNTAITAEESNTDGPIIKRVIATAGQRVNIDFESGTVYVDDVALSEPYARTTTNRQGDVEFPLVVPDGCVFVLGDNRNDSLDSRFSTIGDNGMIDKRYILGKAIFRILPMNRFGGLY